MKSISSTPNERKYKTNTCPLTDLENPGKKASAFPVYTKSRLAVPDGINESNVHEMLQLLEDDPKVLTQFEESLNIPVVEFHEKKYYNKTEEYEIFFEIGSEVLVKWTKEEIGDSGWRPGWFLAEVQDSNLANDWIKVEYKSERCHIYKIEVLTALANNKLKMMGSLF